MKRVLQGVGGILLLFLLGVSVVAQEVDTYVEQQLQEGGAVALWEQLDGDTRRLFEKIGITSLSDLMNDGMDAAGLLDMTGELLREQSAAPLAAMGTAFAAIVLCAYVGGLKDALGSENINDVYQTVCSLVICGVVAIPFVGCMQSVNATLDAVAVFMGSFSPVYVAVLAAGGNIRAAFSYQTVLLMATQLLGFLSGGVLLPILMVALAMGIISTVSQGVNVGKPGEMLLKAVSWILGTTSAIFTAFLTVNGMLGAAGENFGSRIAKLSIAGMVPVVGGALSEAFLTVKGCVGVARTTIGAFGVVTTTLLILPPLIRCFCWQLCLWGGMTVAEMFDVRGVNGLLKTIHTVNKNMIAIVSISGLFMIIATVVVARGTV